MKKLLIAIVIAIMFLLAGCFSSGKDEADANVVQTSPPELPAVSHGVRDETVYCDLKIDGSVQSASAEVHISIDRPGEYTDAGITNAVALRGEAALIERNERSVWYFEQAEPHFYYKGDIENPVLPFVISLEYELDGKAIEDPSGAAGRLTVKLSASPADNALGGFICRVVFPVDIERCSNIDANGLEGLLEGNTKRYAFEVLPGESRNAVFSFDVNNYRSDGVEIVMYKYTAPVTDSEPGIDLIALYNGLEAVHEGLENLEAAAIELDRETAGLNGGTPELKSGYELLYNGLKSGLDQAIGEISKLPLIFSAYTKGISEVVDGVAIAMESFEHLNGEAVSLYDGLERAAGDSSLLREGLKRMKSAQLELMNSILELQSEIEKQAESDAAKEILTGGQVKSAVNGGSVNSIQFIVITAEIQEK